MKFACELFEKTKNSHKLVDKHLFIDLIRTNKTAARLYIDFNKICIYELQRVLKLEDNILQYNLFRDIQQPDIYINDNLCKLLTLCRIFPLEAEYMFKAGLIMGGNLLKKYVSVVDYDFITFNNPKKLFNNLKEYLEIHVKNKDEFIINVNKIYESIELCFDSFLKRFNNKYISN